MPTINISIPDKLQVLFQENVLDEQGQPVPLLDEEGNQRFVIGPDGLPTSTPRFVHIRNVYIKGGRGGAKSVSMGQFVPLDMLTKGNTWLLAREIQDSIKDSSYKEVKDGAIMLGIDHLFKFQQDKIICIQNGAECLFSGLRYITDSVKSKKGINRVWVEEADKISERSIELLTPTIRAEDSQLFWTYNPNHDNDPVHLRALNPGPRDITVNINWRDNPWFPEVLRYEMEEMKRTDFRKYLRIYEGMTQEQAGETIFMPQWYRTYYNRDSISGNILIVVDPANSKNKKSDYTVILTFCFAHDGNVYLLEGVRDRLKMEKFDILFNLQAKYKRNPRFRSVTVGYERYGMQMDIDYINRRMEEVGQRFKIVELGGKMSKVDRIKRLVPWFKDSRLWLPEFLPYRQLDGKEVDIVQSLKDELSIFNPVHGIPNEFHDDVSDCASRISDTELNMTFPDKAKLVPEERQRRRKEYDPARYGFD